MDEGDFTDAEKLLWKSFPRGLAVDFGDESPEIRAEVITELLLGAVSPEPGHVAGIRLNGATVTGRVDLRGGTVTCPLVFENCRFEDDLVFEDCSMRTVTITGSQLYGFIAMRTRVDGQLKLERSTIARQLRLEHATVRGRLRLRGVQVASGTRLAAVIATGLSVGGDVDCTDMTAHGSVGFETASISGSLKLPRATVVNPGDCALTLNQAEIGGNLECQGLSVDGETRARNCRIGARLTMNGARLQNPGGRAFSGGGLEIGGGAFFRDGFTALGAVRLIGARLSANLSMEGGRFENPADKAVNLDYAKLGALTADRVSCEGQLSLESAGVSGDVLLAGAILEAPGGEPALNAERAHIGGKVILDRATVTGEVNLRGAEVGEQLLLKSARLSTPGGDACRLTRARVAGDIDCTALTMEGQLRMPAVSVGRRVILDRARFAQAQPGKPVVNLKSLRAEELVLRFASVDGRVDLRLATVDVLRDDPETWAKEMNFDGLTYRVLDPYLSAEERLGWLEREEKGYQPRAYEQLAACYNGIGHPTHAREVRYESERLAHHGKGLVARAWDAFLNITVGYGYKQLRALGWFVGLWGIGAIVFSLNRPAPLRGGGTSAPHFNGIVYPLDLMLPVANLGQKDAFNPAGPEQWLAYFLTVAGWVLATTVAAGAARVLRR